MARFFRFFIRASAFLRKEIFEVLRQPRLVLSLVLGPFLILFLFGIGYRNQARPLRTLFVAEKGSPIARQIQDYATTLGPQLIFMGVTDTQDAAIQRLRRGEVDLVAVAPTNAYETIRNNQQAVFTLYHNEIDPFQAEYVKYFGQIYVNEVNRRVLRTITQEGQSQASTVQDDLEAARASAADLRQALERGDAAAAHQHQRALSRDLSAVELAVGASLGLLTNVQQTLGSDNGNEASQVRASLTDVRQNTNSLNEIDTNRVNYRPEIERVAKIEGDLATLESKLKEFQRIDPTVLVSPFRSEPKSVAPVAPRISDYFAPAVIVLLLQHLGVTLAALSFVRERQLGTIELFRVSPISSVETLLGKYASYLLFAGLLAAILTALLIFGLRVPMLGLWTGYTLVIIALLFTSLSFGFVISLMAQTDNQAVQYSMIMLLTAVFFSGFFLSLDTLWAPVRVISWALPATYGILLLQNIMLRGYLANPNLLFSLTAIGVVLFFMALLLLQRQMARS
ncbi:MAG TPA: hypothetical protein DEP84_18415 [Chloroflexi bacterium]|nr:hypothetical protein [Chloroflexota bacterium]